jgi:phosphatidylglycerol:prolipoprotein diacylglycerol transferase
MRSTLFTIPSEAYGIPVFGIGILLAVWTVAAALILFQVVRRDGWTRELIGYLPALAIGGAAIAFVLPRLMDPAGMPIRGYGVMLVLAVAGGVGISAYRAHRAGLDPELIFSLAVWLFLSGIVGARLFYVMEYWHEKFEKPSLLETLLLVINIPEGGLVVYGSLLAGGLALIVFVYKYRLPGFALADLIAPGVVLGMALGRLGCFLNGCCYGGTCELPWAMEFPFGSPPHRDQVQGGRLFVHGLLLEDRAGAVAIRDVQPGYSAEASGLRRGDVVVGIGDKQAENRFDANNLLLAVDKPGSTISITTAKQGTKTVTVEQPLVRSLPIHPSQLYSAIDAGLLCLLLVVYTPFRRKDGELMALTLTLHPISRYIIEIIRVDEQGVLGTLLSISQVVSLLIFAGGLLVWGYLYFRPRGVAWFGGPAAQLARPAKAARGMARAS